MFRRTESILKRKTSFFDAETVKIVKFWFLFIPLYSTEEILSSSQLR